MFSLIACSVKWFAAACFVVGVGYVVFIVASKEKGALRTIGYGIGIALFCSSIAFAIIKICASHPCEESHKRVIADDLGPERIVDIPGPMAPPKK